MDFKEIIQEKFKDGYTPQKIADEMTKTLNEVMTEQRVVNEYVEKAVDYCNLYIGLKHPEGKKVSIEDLQSFLDAYAVLDDVIAELVDAILPNGEKNGDALENFINKMGW